jgi:2-polyprenyl-3-methyl-5-hydroxy-6-metoxy-1,4-benzoquinol methylase
MSYYDCIKTDLGNGARASFLVKQFFGMAPSGKALDLGCGGGGDSVFLAKNGFDVTALDNSQEGIEKVIKLAEKHNVQVDCQTSTLQDFRFLKNRYSLIIVNHIFQHLKKSEILEISEKILYGLKKGGLLVGSSITTADPSYKEMHRKKIPEVESNCFTLPNGWIYSFFEFREVLDIFPEMQILHYSETDFYETKRGRSGWHGLVEFALKMV